MDTISNFIKKKKSITFIGMPGTGKSFTSDFFSKKYNIPMIELDAVIEKKYNNTLPEIIKIYFDKNNKINIMTDYKKKYLKYKKKYLNLSNRKLDLIIGKLNLV